MISEYALDPALVAQWHDPKEWAFYREALADGTGRIGCAFPGKWRKAVVKSFHQLFPNATSESDERRRLEALLDRLEQWMTSRDATRPDCATWLDKTIAEHRDRPFHGILSTMPAAAVAEVITPDMLFSASPPLPWTVPPCPPISRDAGEFARALHPLLTRCKEAVFVDPWFDPRKKRFVDSLRAMLAVLWGPDSCVDSPSAQLVIAEGIKENDPKNRNGQWLMDECKDRLPRILPKGHRIAVTVLRPRGSGERIHNRYVLTKFCGVSFGSGLDAADDEDTKEDRPTRQTDDLCRLSREQLVSRWGQYVSVTSPFDIAAGPVSIMGSGR